MIFAQGSRFGGYSLFVKDGKLTYVYNFLGIPPEQRIVADAPTSGTHIVGVEFTKERMGEHHEPHGPLKLYVDDQVVAEGEIRTIASRYSPLRRGPVHRLRRRRRGQQRVHAEVRVHGGRIVKVVFDVADDAYVDVERRAGARRWRLVTDLAILERHGDAGGDRGVRRRRPSAGAANRRLRQRRHTVVREADADPARLHPAPLAAMAEDDPRCASSQPWKAAYERDHAWLGGVDDQALPRRRQRPEAADRRRLRTPSPARPSTTTRPRSTRSSPRPSTRRSGARTVTAATSR